MVAGSLSSCIRDDFEGASRSNAPTILEGTAHRSVPPVAARSGCGPCTRCSRVSCCSHARNESLSPSRQHVEKRQSSALLGHWCGAKVRNLHLGKLGVQKMSAISDRKSVV